jgi:hypothetical protein
MKMSAEENKNFALRHLFVNRADCYCRQNGDGSYAKIDGPLTLEVLERHLKGEITIGAYQLGEDNSVKYLCFDFDPEKLARALILKQPWLSCLMCF